MARRVSKRKKPPKEKYQLKERFKIEDKVFDKETLISISKIFKKGILDHIDYCISTGKEANVFRATTPDNKYVAVKIYKTETSHFIKKEEYIRGDPRFEKIKHTGKNIVNAFARKEFKNLELCEKAGINAPKPYYQIDNLIVMEFLGEGELPYPTMEMVGPQHGKKDLESIIENIKKAYSAKLVHADLSEYNILMGNVTHLIDWGQGVVKGHPNTMKFLERDIRIILDYFRKKGIEKNFEKTIEDILS